MKLFSSVSLDYQGRKCSGNFEAVDEASARSMLKAQGYQVISIREIIEKNAGIRTQPSFWAGFEFSPALKKAIVVPLGLLMALVALYLGFNIIRSGEFSSKSKAPAVPSAAVVKTAVSKPASAETSKAALPVSAAAVPAESSSENSGAARDTVLGVLEDARDKGLISEQDFQSKKQGVENSTRSGG